METLTSLVVSQRVIRLWLNQLILKWGLTAQLAPGFVRFTCSESRMSFCTLFSLYCLFFKYMVFPDNPSFLASPYEAQTGLCFTQMHLLLSPGH